MTIAAAEPVAGRPPERPQERPEPRRIDLVDTLRGAALLAMFAYHFAWDLSFFRLIATDVVAHTGWRWFAHGIAGTFLGLVGASLVLATRRHLDRGAYLRRLALVAGAAALVTAGTYAFMPDAYVFFGILHHIAVASVIALPFLVLPTLAVAGAAVTAFALPGLVAVHPALNGDLLLWIGLGDRPIRSGDFVPLLPWFGCVLAGIVAARLALALVGEDRLAAWRARSRPAALLAAMGRHSLPIYLVHQPLFIALLSAWVWLLPATAGPPRAADADTGPFIQSCLKACTSGGRTEEDCRDACECTADGLKRDNLWGQALTGRMSTAERDRVGEIARICTRGE